MITITLNNRIREIRTEKKISGTKIAKEVGISPQYFYDIEKGERNLSAELAVKIAASLDVSLSYLLMEDQRNKFGHGSESIYRSEVELKSEILDSLKLMTDDEGYFLEDIKEKAFLAVASNLHMASAYHEGNKHKYYFQLATKYMENPNLHQRQLIIDELDEAYNYKTIKLVLPKNNFDEKSNFLEAVQKIIIENDLKQKETPEKEFIGKLELSDEKLLKQFDLELDGQKLSEDEAKGVIAYLRSLRQIDK